MPNNGFIALLKDAGLSPALQASLLATLIAVVAVWGAHGLVQRLLVSRVKNPTARFSTRRVVRYVALLTGVFVIGRIWYAGIESVATVVGLLGAGIAIALKDPLTNVAGWVFLIVRHPFRIGDRIKIGTHTGDVVDIGLFQFELQEIGAWVDAEQATGRIVLVPNARVFTEPQINYHRGVPFIWEELPVRVTFESDWQKARELIEEAGRKHALADHSIDTEGARRAGDTGYFLLGTSTSCEVFTSVHESGVLLTLRYAVDPRQRRGTASRVWDDILDAVAAHGEIEFAYQTYRRVQHEPLSVLSQDRVPNGGSRPQKDPA